MRSTRVRNIVATVLGVLAVLLLTVGLVGVWTRATVSSGERVASLVNDALEKPEVGAGLSEYLTDTIFTSVDVESVLTTALPDQLQRFAPVLVSGARTAVERGLEVAISEPRVQDLITRLVERAHAAAMRLLQGDGLADGISVSDGAVTINLLPLVGRGLTRLQDLGLLQDVQVPELSADGDPATQVAELETALDRDLPDDFGQLVVYQSDRLANAQASVERAQQTVAIVRRALWLILALAVVLIAAAVLVAGDRWRATMVLGLAVIAAMVLTRSAVERVVEEAPDLAQRPAGRAAIAAIVGGASESLLRLAAVVLILGAVAAIVAMAFRRWRREDLVLAAAVIVGVLVVGVLGLTIWSLVLGIALAVLVPIITWRVIGRTV